MSQAYQAPVVKALLSIHSVITRGLGVAKSRSELFAQHGLADASLRSGFISYAASFVSVTHAHHLTEDELIFPHFRGLIREAPFDRWTAQHQEISSLLDAMQGAIGDAESNSQAVEPFSRIGRIATGLAEIWHPHIAEEESFFTSERVDAKVTMDEQLGLVKEATEHSMKHSGPDYLVVPFILYNLSPEARATLSAGMPPVVTQQLVPVVWKEKWEPMSPFLLA